MEIKSSPDRILITTVFILVSIGVIMIYSSSGYMSQSKLDDQLYYFKKQLTWLALSLPFLFMAYKLNYQIYHKLAAPALLLGFLLLTAVLFLPATRGVHRWIRIGPINVQATEVFKYCIIVFMAHSLSKQLGRIQNFKEILLPYLAILVMFVLLILKEPDLGSTILICAIFVTMLFISKARLTHLATFMLPAVAGFLILVFGLGYEKDRMESYLKGLNDPLAGSYQLRQSAISLGSGGWNGIGLGEGRQKFLFLPEPHTDFIFASIGEEGGFVALSGILGLFLLIALRGVNIATRAPDYFGFLLAAGISIAIFFSVLVNVGVVTGVLPTTGIPLPFLSYGGSSLVLSLCAVGILLNISKQSVAT